MKITLTTTEGIKEFEDIETLKEKQHSTKVFELFSYNPKVAPIEFPQFKVLLIHVTKEGE